MEEMILFVILINGNKSWVDWLHVHEIERK